MSTLNKNLNFSTVWVLSVSEEENIFLRLQDYIKRWESLKDFPEKMAIDISNFLLIYLKLKVLSIYLL